MNVKLNLLRSTGGPIKIFNKSILDQIADYKGLSKNGNDFSIASIKLENNFYEMYQCRAIASLQVFPMTENIVKKVHAATCQSKLFELFNIEDDKNEHVQIYLLSITIKNKNTVHRVLFITNSDL
jgi:hypothetical protein